MSTVHGSISSWCLLGRLLNIENLPNFSSSVIKQAKDIFNNWNLSTDSENTNAALQILTFAKYIDVKPDNLSDQIIIKQLIFSISHLGNLDFLRYNS